MYLYVFEDETITQRTTPPSDADQMSVADGYLRVIRFRGGIFEELNGSGAWVDVEMTKEQSR